MNSEFRIGRRLVQPELNTIVTSGRAARVEPKVMEVLVYLADRPGQVVQRETLIRDLWGDTFVTDAALTRCVAELRKLFDDDVRDPRVIQTIAKSGYRLIAAVEPAEAAQAADVEAAPKATVPRMGHRGVVIAITAIALALVSLILLWRRGPTPRPGPVVRFTLPLRGHGVRYFDAPVLALSSDGATLVYSASEVGPGLLYLRRLDGLESVAIAGTERAWSPFLSPDGEWVGFEAGGKLQKVRVAGGAPVALCDLRQPICGADWTRDGWMVFSDGHLLLRVRDSGGAPQEVARSANDELYRRPQVLPGETHVLFDIAALGQPTREVVAVAPLGGGVPKVLVRDAGAARYVPPGYLVYSSGGSLTAATFDAKRLEVSGVPVKLLERVPYFALSASMLVCARDDRRMRLVWVSRDGSFEPLPLPPAFFHHPALSPDGRRIAVGVDDDHISIYSLETGTLTQLTFDRGAHWPIWTPDGQRVAYSYDGRGVYWRMADGTGPEERLTVTLLSHSADSFSPDGNLLVFGEYGGRSGPDLTLTHFTYLLRLGRGAKPEPLLGENWGAAVSPDGRWLAYHDPGRSVHVQGFPTLEAKWAIPIEGPREPRWSRDGTELF